MTQPKLSRFCLDQLKVQDVKPDGPTQDVIDCLNARARYFQSVLTGPQAACLFGDQRQAVEGYLRKCLTGVAAARRFAAS
jgi:hypothetical protein